MKYFFIILLVFCAACNGNKQNNIQANSDTSLINSEKLISDSGGVQNQASDSVNSVETLADTARLVNITNAESDYEFGDSEIVKIGTSYDYVSLGEFFKTNNTIRNMHIIVDEGVYFDKEIFVSAENVIIQALGKVSLYCTELYQCVMTITGENILVKGFHMTHI